MDTHTATVRLRDAARTALAAQDQLLNAWRSIPAGDYPTFSEATDVELLKLLIWRRIYPLNAFGALVRIDKNAAVDILMTLYLGRAVDPDTKYGGYVFELSTMLDDLRETYGAEVLCEVIKHPMFDRERISDKRVIEAFSDALGLDASCFSHWLEQVS